MRLIDAYSAKGAIEYTLVGDAASLAQRVIDRQPTVDAVPVVRCRECVNCLIDNTERKYHLCMRHNSIFPRKVDLMDFCSYGERKEGADG